MRESLNIPETIICEDVMLEQISLFQSEDLFNLIIQNKLMLQPFFSWINEDFNLDHMVSFIEDAKEEIENSDAFYFSIFDKKEDLLIGVITIKVKDKIANIYDIGYWLDKDFQSRGIIHDCVTRVSEILFNDLDANRLEIKIVPAENKRSINIAEKAGFILETKQYNSEIFNNKIVDSLIFVNLKDDKKYQELKNNELKLKEIFSISSSSCF